MSNTSTLRNRQKTSFHSMTGLFLLAFFLFSVTANAQFQWLNPKPAGFHNLKILFTNQQDGFLLNMNNDLLRTTNTGESWEYLTHFPEGNEAMDIKDSTGVVSGNFGMIYLSTDNGLSWDPVTTGIDNYFTFVQVVSRDTFFITGGNQNGYGKLYRTDDRGKTWANLNCGLPIHSIYFVNSKTGFVGSSQGKILKTEDGGITWQQKRAVSIIPSGIDAIQFLDKDTGFAFQKPNLLCRTYDGGNTWEETPSLQTEAYALHFINSKDGYLAGADGGISVTHDGGKTLEAISYNNRDVISLTSVHFLSKDSGFAVGLNGKLMRTTDGGMNWLNYSPTHQTVKDLSIADSSHAYFITSLGSFKTADKGQTWQPAGLTTGGFEVYNKNFENVHFFSADTGFITSRSPLRIHHTLDGGKTWDTLQVSARAGNGLRNLQFIDRKTGYMTEHDEYGNNWILKTTDGGLTWQDNGPDRQRGFKKVQFLNEDILYAHTTYSLYKSTDGGENWRSMYDNNNPITTLHFSSPDTGHFATNEAHILSTTDGGITWKRLRVAEFGDLYSGNITDMQFLDGRVGYFCNMDTYQTIDGGKTWQKIINTSANSLIISSDSTLFLYGDGGTVVSYKIQQVRVDSLHLPKSCSNELSALVTAIFTRADSISFELTDAKGKTISLPATPSFVENEMSWVTVPVSISADSHYSVQLKYQVEGKVLFSDAVKIKSQGVPPPIIQVEGNRLISNTFNNQWYRNDTLIAGADQSVYTMAPQPYKQCFKVSHTTDNECVIFSEPICFDIKPVIPLLINGILLENEVLLTWTAAAEPNLLSFEVVKSKNGYQYETIDHLPVNSSPGEQVYTYRDPAVSTTANRTDYYRVRKVYANGSVVQSNSVMIVIPSRPEKVIAAPNPTTGKTTIYFPEEISHATILVYDQFGKKVHSEQVTSPGKSYEINLVGLKPGIYTITVVTDKQPVKLKVVIIR